MKNLKLMVAEGSLLNEKEMNAVRGGEAGSLYVDGNAVYENQGGSSTANNNAANKKDGLHSPGMIHWIWKMNEDGSWSPCDIWVKVV